jgi:hypothetical protein
MTDDTLLHRQVHPTWVQQGHITSQVFRPTPKDGKKISAYDGGQIAAKDAWDHFTGTLGFASAGVVSVTPRECCSEGVQPVSDPAPFPEHVLIDFTAHDDAAIRRISKRLKEHATVRGWQFRAE